MDDPSLGLPPPGCEARRGHTADCANCSPAAGQTRHWSPHRRIGDSDWGRATPCSWRRWPLSRAMWASLRGYYHGRWKVRSPLCGNTWRALLPFDGNYPASRITLRLPQERMKVACRETALRSGRCHPGEESNNISARRAADRVRQGQQGAVRDRGGGCMARLPRRRKQASCCAARMSDVVYRTLNVSIFCCTGQDIRYRRAFIDRRVDVRRDAGRARRPRSPSIPACRSGEGEEADGGGSVPRPISWPRWMRSARTLRASRTVPAG